MEFDFGLIRNILWVILIVLFVLLGFKVAKWIFWGLALILLIALLVFYFFF